MGFVTTALQILVAIYVIVGGYYHPGQIGYYAVAMIGAMTLGLILGRAMYED